VMRLREENETLMETLVRAKVELAETQGAVLASLQVAMMWALALIDTLRFRDHRCYWLRVPGWY
jgi:hypothetical protein